jgi:hypothetical protein
VVPVGQYALVTDSVLKSAGRAGGQIVAPSDFMTEREAAKTLGIDGVGWRVARGIRHPANLADRTKGVARASVEAEVNWQRSATRWMRTRREIGGLLQWF